jgi:hypothetical protein
LRSIALAAVCLCACGPIGATSVIADAEVAVARAHAADGDKYAIYETTAADLYLQKAREQQGAAEYATAIELAHKSVELANQGAAKAAEAKKAPPPAPAPPASIQRPPEAKPAEAPRVIIPEKKEPIPIESLPPPPPPEKK